MLRRFIYYKLLMAFNAFRRSNSEKRARSLSSGFILALVFFFVYHAVRSGFDAIGLAMTTPYATPGSPHQIFYVIPSGLFFAGFSMLIISAITVGLQLLYLAPELNLLMTSPISPKVIFIARYFEALAANSGLFLALSMPILLAYGSSLAALGAGYVLVAFLAVLGFSLITTSIGLMACILLARYVSPAHAIRTVTVIGMTMVVLLFLVSAGMVSNLDTSNHSLRGQWVAYRALLQYPPWSWAGESITRLAMSGDTFRSLISLALLLGTGLLLCLAVTGLANDLWFAGWTSGQESMGHRSHRIPSRISIRLERLLYPFPGILRGVVLKDLKTFTRDARQLTLIIMPVVAVAMLALSLRPRAVSGFSYIHLNMLAPVILLLPLASLSQRISLAAFTNESRSFWIVRSSPAGMFRVLIGKLIYSSIVSISASLIGLLIVHLFTKSTLSVFWLTAAFLSIVSITLCGMGIGLAAIFVDFNRENPRESVSLSGRMLSLAFSMIYLVFCVILAVVSWQGITRLLLPPSSVLLLSFLTFLLISGLFAFVPIAFGSDRLSRLEWF
jgi:hypothetical protein